MKRQGVTLIELLIFLAIFSVVIISFITIFVSVLQVYSRQSASSEVNRQTQIVLQTLQYHIERSSLVDMPKDLATTTIKLRMPQSSVDPTYIYLSNGKIYIKESENGSPEALTTDTIRITNVSFTRRDNSPGRDSVAISFTAEFITDNIQKSFVQRLDTAVARVSAATFDSDVIASSSNTFHLGVGNANWKSINSTIYFSSTSDYVGIGVQTPGSKLQVRDGDIFIDTSPYGLIMKDTNGVCWRIRVTTGGAFTSASTTCP